MRYLHLDTHLDAETPVRVDVFPASSGGRPFVSLNLGEIGSDRITLMVTPEHAPVLRALALAAREAAQVLENMTTSSEVSA